MSTSATFDPLEFRKALGTFATGVTIITTRADDGTPLGLTVNSFNSVSLDPPLVLWSLANSALSFDAFRKAGHWAVHVLAADQEELSARFARRGEDKFGGLDLEQGIGGVPLLKGCAARFQCRTASQYQGGDHLIFIGEVLAFDRDETAPLVFHGGRYAHATRRDPAGIKPRSAYLAGSFGEDFLGYLLGRSHFRFFAQIRPYLAEAGLSDEEFYVLASLTLKPQMSAEDLAIGMQGVLDEQSQAAVQALVDRGLARIVTPAPSTAGTAYELSDDGRNLALRLIAQAKSVESQVLERLGHADAVVIKSLLNRLLAVIDPQAAVLWGEPPR
ncbi:3-hydroxy-9,10-secoandrosta-1,3,5(10)-triene-9,17-dione monooxygenase reductase component [Fontimonas thermophila]|uniref:3-hydroxy-9,10-secoandrosta-1,3,5(10)-triene-9,17-dione monooxygenase reductase component n=1 Tax=Fontimonas thermophila TaxID=1076937 RepID=A0A1I2HBM6_9GAMM|nr:flavin reductase [Fontimonas thermophila]SFF26773.1 3-hydroxy-9,10-secoandrosta-1,3,5(10)-triene-9,17-dione monooxygenase reductase component [Fontimonas thermophila]